MADKIEMGSEEAIKRLEQMGNELAKEVAKWLGEDEFEEAQVLWCDGDIQEADFSVPDVVVVTGDLAATGNLTDCGDVDASFLAVLGDLSAKNVITMGRILVGGDMKVQDLVYGNSLNDLWLEVHGNLHAKALAEGGHYCEVKGRIDVVHAIRTHNQIISKSDSSLVVKDGSKMQEVFVEAVLSDGIVDRALLVEHLKTNATALSI